MMDLGIQMYSLRNYVADAGIDKTLLAVKSCGFDCIEPICCDYGIGYKAVGILMKNHGLKARSMHVALDFMLDINKLSQLKDAFGFETAVIPWMDKESFFNSEKRAEILGKAIENATALSLTIAYHNHNFELDCDGVLESVPKDFPPIKLQPDIFWLKAAGKSPINFLRENAENIELLHIKEYGGSIDTPAPIVGSGYSDSAQALVFARDHGHKSVILEYEKPCEDDISYITKSIEFMRGAING